MIPAGQSLRINQESPGIPKIDDAPWPGFPADLTSIMTVVATQCKGTVLIFEKMFESRLFCSRQVDLYGSSDPSL